MHHPPPGSGQHNAPMQNGRHQQQQQPLHTQHAPEGEHTPPILSAAATPAFSLAPLEVEHCVDICDWAYSPPYDLYSWQPWEQMAAEQIEFGDPVIRALQYAAVLGSDGKLAGFAQFFPLLGVTRLGLGMAPSLCGQGRGIGVSFVQAIIAEAQRRAPADEIDLEVLTWNERARIVYERAGFAITDTYTRPTPTGDAEFHCMVYHPHDNPNR